MAGTGSLSPVCLTFSSSHLPLLDSGSKKWGLLSASQQWCTWLAWITADTPQVFSLHPPLSQVSVQLTWRSLTSLTITLCSASPPPSSLSSRPLKPGMHSLGPLCLTLQQSLKKRSKVSSCHRVFIGRGISKMWCTHIAILIVTNQTVFGSEHHRHCQSSRHHPPPPARSPPSCWPSGKLGLVAPTVHGAALTGFQHWHHHRHRDHDHEHDGHNCHDSWQSFFMIKMVLFLYFPNKTNFTDGGWEIVQIVQE